MQNLVAKKEEVETQNSVTVKLSSGRHTCFKNQASKVMPGYSYVVCQLTCTYLFQDTQVSSHGGLYTSSSLLSLVNNKVNKVSKALFFCPRQVASVGLPDCYTLSLGDLSSR